LTSHRDLLILSGNRNNFFYRKFNPKKFNVMFAALRRGGIMSDFSVTDLAVSKLKEYMEQNNIDSALRVALMQGG
jgi:hypothetical protein